MTPVLDAVTGALLATVGIVGWRRFRSSAVFALAAAACWFAAAVVPFLVLVHRPLLLHSILALPRRPRHGPTSRVLLVVAWLGVALPAEVQPWSSVLTAALCLATAAGLRRDPGRDPRPQRAAAARALILLSAGLTLPILERLAGPDYAETDIPLATYLCALSACAVSLMLGILAPVRLVQEDEVIELADSTPAQALTELRRLAEHEPRSEKRRVLDASVALLEENDRLQRELAERIGEVRASRARLVGAAVEERRRLEQLLNDGATRYLRELEECVVSTDGHGQGDARAVACLEEVAHTRDDLAQLARGLHPRVLTDRGLAAALEELSERGPVPVEVHSPPGRFPVPVETAVWYACAEALANVWKHARATRAVVRVTESAGTLRATVQDDGVGGAGLAPGGGLAGLADRVSVLDGRLSLTSSSTGTDVTVEVPLR